MSNLAELPLINPTHQAQQASLPPMLKLYQEYKRSHADYLILMQVGDFYEAFFEDAVTISRALNLTLTSRDKNNPNPIPMCGVPLNSIDSYLERLVDQGFSAALVRQIGDPAAKKGMVERELERIVTPGIRLFSRSAAGREESIIAAVAVGPNDEVAILCGDISKGVLFARDGISLERLDYELRLVNPAELILPNELNGKPLDRRSSLVRQIEMVVGASCKIKFRRIDAFQLGRELPKTTGFANLTAEGKRAAALLISYADEVTLGAKLSFREIVSRRYDNVVSIDPATREHLELVKNQRDGSSEGSLLHYMDLTVTAAGYRLLKEWILAPLIDPHDISSRHDALQYLRDNKSLREELRQALTVIPDLDRLASRLELEAILPRECIALASGVEALGEIAKTLDKYKESLPNFIQAIISSISVPEELVSRIRSTLRDDPAQSFNEGGIIRSGFNAELDRLSGIRSDGRSILVELEAREKARCGIQNLKVKFNNVFGYFIEITKANLSKVPDDYIRKQTTVNGERFITEELKKLEEELLGAESKVIELERTIFIELRTYAKQFSLRLRELSIQAALLDVIAAFAELSQREMLIRPEINDSRDLLIHNGKHPVLARMLQRAFIPNSLNLEGYERYCGIITGPNMGGKSTFLRQTALIVIMAQLGCFVSAESVTLGVVDKIFTRIGASDNMAEGESTFMVEMREAAHIVQSATDRSLVVIDEIGRGTATADGLSIAQSILEWIVVELHSRTLFATHFHELTTLDRAYPAVFNLSVGSVDNAGEIIFTHQIADGPANKSYGIEVAKLAGLPLPLLARARTLLSVFDRLQGESKRISGMQKEAQLSFFPTPAPKLAAQVGIEKFREPEDYQALRKLGEKIKAIDLNNLSPLAALNLLNEIKEESGKPEGAK